MTKEGLAELGLSETDVLDRLVEKLFEHYSESEEGYKSDFESRMEKAIKQRVDERLAKCFEEHVLPLVVKMTDGICFEATNKWGEPKGEKLTLTEYLVQRADAYIREEVDYNGKAKEQDSYNWRKHGTRISHMIHEHLQYHIQRAMTEALGNVNSSVRKGLEEAVKIAINSLKVTVDTKVTT